MEERRAKLFQNGRSQAVRLPVDMRFEGAEVAIRRVGETVVLSPVRAVSGADAAEALRKAARGMGTVDKEFGRLLKETAERLESGK